MENSTIALLIRYFNILSVTVMAFFAVYGVITLFAKSSHLNIFRGRLFIQAFCVASLLAFALESTVFNFPHYLKYFSDGEFHTLEVSPLDSMIILTSDGTIAEKYSSTAQKDTTKENNDMMTFGQGIKFKNVNRRITSVFIEPVFDTTDWINVVITGTDEAIRFQKKISICRGLPNTNYISFQVCGKVSELTVDTYGTRLTGASMIAVNRQVPLYFSGLRLIVVSLLLFAVILFVYKPLRVKTAYLLFDYRFDPLNGKQNVIYILSVASLILFSWICAYTSVVEDSVQAKQYNKYLVDALVAGRTHLEAGNPEKTLRAERLYDLKWMEDNGYKRDVDWMSDWVFYKGKFYCYFGVVPALMLYIPYNLITGNYLSNNGGIFVFAALSIVLLARLWRFLVKKYMLGMRFAFYILSFFTLFFAGGWFGPLRFTRFYSIVSSAGFMFVVAGILLLLESVEREKEKTDLSKLVLACACLALAVGCRPNLIFASLAVPVILWKYRLWKYAPLIAIPYIMTAIPMCLYNYDRFGSIFEFGLNYNMTNLNVIAYKQLNPIGKILNTFNISLSYLFSPNRYSLFYPYVECLPLNDKFFWTIIKFYDKGCGMVNYPIIFCLFCFIKSVFRKENRPGVFYISATFLAIAAVLILVNSWMVGHSGRYMIDFAVFIILPSLFCAYYWCDGGDDGTALQPQKNQVPLIVRQKVTYVLLAFSIFVGLFLFATSVTNDATPDSPQLYYYLRQSLILFGTL